MPTTAALPQQLSKHLFWTKLITSMTWVEVLFYITMISQTTSIFARKLILPQLTKPVNAHKNCSRHVKTRRSYVKTGTHHGYVPTQKVRASVLWFPPKPYSCFPVNVQALPKLPNTTTLWSRKTYYLAILLQSCTRRTKLKWEMLDLMGRDSSFWVRLSLCWIGRVLDTFKCKGLSPQKQ